MYRGKCFVIKGDIIHTSVPEKKKLAFNYCFEVEDQTRAQSRITFSSNFKRFSKSPGAKLFYRVFAQDRKSPERN